ncbi:site-specific integrase, partial [Escherichia coli]
LKDVCPAEKWIDLRAEGSKTHREWRIPVARQLQPQLQKLLDEAVRRGATPEDYLFHHKRFVVPVSEAKRITGLPDEQPVKSFFRRLSQECGFQVSPH